MTTLNSRPPTKAASALRPAIRRVVAKGLELEGEGASNTYYLGWEWHEIPVPLPKRKVLVEEEIVRINYHSRSTTTYMVKDPDLARQALEAIGDGGG